MNYQNLVIVRIAVMTAFVVGIQFFVPITVGPNVACAQNELADRIDSIRIEGNQRIESETIISYLTTSVGDVFDSVSIDQSLKKLFDTGLFADVVMRRNDQTLIVQVVENPVINRLAFEGNRYLKDAALRAEVQLRPRVVYTRTKVQRDLTRLLEVYRRSGHFSARVEPRVIQLEQNRVDLVFEINEGSSTGIQLIVFVGNRAFSNRKLRGEIQTKESKWWRFLSSNDSYDPDRLNFDQELLRRFYLNEGFADVQISDAVAELTSDGEAFFITFIIEEGRRYRFNNVQLNVDLPNVNADSLVDLVSTKKGDVYNAGEIEDTVQALTETIEERGFAFVDVQPSVERDRDASAISVTYDVGEGSRVYVERVEITGNVRTLDRVIRRNVRVVEGDAFNAAKIRRSRQLIENLGFFASIDIKNRPGSAADRRVLNIDVNEKSTGELTFGAGFSSDVGVLATAGIRERNLLGRGQDLKLNFSLSGVNQNIEAGFTEPYFLNREVSAGFDVFDTSRNFRESSFERDRLGFGLHLGYPLTEYLAQEIRYGLRAEDLRAFAGASPSIAAQQGEFVVSSVGQTLGYNRLDRRLNPSDGYFYRLSNDLAGLGGDREWLRTKIEAGQYEPFWDGWVVSLLGEVGYIAGLGNQDVKISDRWFLGGRAFRGFKVAGVGPRDISNNNALGGNFLYKATTELAFPFGLPKELGIKARVFSVAGSLQDVDEDNVANLGDTGSLRASVGIGISWDSPFGPVRLDYARPILSEDFDEKEFFSFGVGTFF